ncbi:MAG: glycosyltransferase [Phenylobacterium sp.]|nr:glycosyltransferase [Phenylobacterium sp.]MDP2213490.1 glycosyltransferase [Phenylobacterium sp.]
MTAEEQQSSSILQVTLRADIGGGPEHLHQLLLNWPNRFRAIVAAPREAPYWDRFESAVGPDNMSELPHRRFSFGSLCSLAVSNRTRRVRLIHSHGKGAGAYARVLGFLSGAVCVHTFHGLHVGEYGRLSKALYLLLERVLGYATAAAICVSEGERRAIAATGILPERKLHVIENGVATPPVRSGEPDDEIIQLIGVSRYDHQKNAELMIEIAENLAAMPGFGPFRLTVYGTGERLAACRARVFEKGLSSVIDLPGATVSLRKAFRCSHIFLSTSRWEGMPMAVLEAMSENLPVVATDVVGNHDVVRDGETGVLFPNEDPVSGAAAVAQLRNRDFRRRLGEAGRRQVEHSYSVRRMVERTQALYEQVLACS